MNFVQHFGFTNYYYSGVDEFLNDPNDYNLEGLTFTRLSKDLKYENLTVHYHPVSFLILVPSSRMMNLASFGVYGALLDTGKNNNRRTQKIFMHSNWNTASIITKSPLNHKEVVCSPEAIFQRLVIINNEEHFNKLRWNDRRILKNRRVFYDYEKEDIYDIIEKL